MKSENRGTIKDRSLDPVAEIGDFIKSLTEEPALDTTFTGMVQSCDDGDPKALMFAPLGNCGHWVKIPGTAIASAKRLGFAPCQGHRHVAAQITLHAPAGEVATAFAKLADVHRTTLGALGAASAVSPFQIGLCNCPPGTTPVYGPFGNCTCQ